MVFRVKNLLASWCEKHHGGKTTDMNTDLMLKLGEDKGKLSFYKWQNRGPEESSGFLISYRCLRTVPDSIPSAQLRAKTKWLLLV